MQTFTEKDFEGNGAQFSIGDIKLRILLGNDGKYNCTAQYRNLICCAICNHFKAAIKSAMGKLAWALIEYGDIVKISDKDGGEWFNKSFMGDFEK